MQAIHGAPLLVFPLFVLLTGQATMVVAIQTNTPKVTLSLSRKKKALTFSCVNRKLNDVLFLTKKRTYSVSGMTGISKHVKKKELAVV